jgi:hypothetical protein
MSATVHFSTGFTYTFLLGQQPVADLQKWGGVSLRREDIESGGTEHRLHILWTMDDIPGILVRLHRVALHFGEEMPNFSAYTKGIHGTEGLYWELVAQRVSPLFRLGCVLYHQLLYRVPLEVVWLEE